MNEELVLSAVALAAIISPILTTILSNAHNTKIKKLEMKRHQYEQNVLHVIDIFENYLKSVSSIMSRQSSDEVCKMYGTYYPLAYIYASDETKKLMIECNKFILPNPTSKIHWDKLEELFNLVHKDLISIKNLN